MNGAVMTEPAAIGRWSAARALVDSDADWIHRIHVGSDALVRFRLGGRTPSAATLFTMLERESLANFVLTGRTDPTPVALVTFDGANASATRAHMSVIADPAHRRRGAAVEGMGLALDLAFASWPLRLVLAEVVDPEASATSAALGRIFEPLLILPEHTFSCGAFRDVGVYGLRRDRWASIRGRFLR